MAIKVKKSVTGNEPITLEEAKAWMKVDGTADDTLITELITQARELIENYLNRSLVATTITCDATPRYELRPPYGPVETITSVVDENGDPVEYYWDGFVITFGSSTFSVTQGWTPIYTTTSYDTATEAIPSGLKLAMLETITYLYEFRGDGMDNKDTRISMFLYQNQNLQPYRESVWI